MDAAAAPEEDEEEDSEAENNDNVLQDPVAKRDVFLAFLGAHNRRTQCKKCQEFRLRHL